MVGEKQSIAEQAGNSKQRQMSFLPFYPIQAANSLVGVSHTHSEVSVFRKSIKLHPEV